MKPRSAPQLFKPAKPDEGPLFFPAFPHLPGWITAASTATNTPQPEDAAFRSGAALAHLHLVAARPEVPKALWRARLALLAAQVCATHMGRREGVGGLRDALHFLRPGDHPGPAGEIFRQWSRAVERPVSAEQLGRVLGGLSVGQISASLAVAGGNSGKSLGSNPVGRVAAVIETVLMASPRAETAALILADAALAQAMGWAHLVPILALGLKHQDLRLRQDALRLACHRAVVTGAAQAATLAADLARGAARVQAVMPKLRAKGAGKAIELFLSHDALAPKDLEGGALGAFMSDRAARRLCDRLVSLGAIRELTGRDTFRLYGV